MPTLKLTMLFKLATNTGSELDPAKRIGGWSESWYTQQANQELLNSLIFGATGLCAKRAGILPIGASVIGQRLQAVDPVGPAQTYKTVFPASSARACDIPQMALLYTVGGLGVRNVRRVIVRGIPDSQVVEGEYKPNADFILALDAFNDELKYWRFRGKDLTATPKNVLTISGVGVVKTVQPHGYNPNDMVLFKRSLTVAGRQPVGGVFAVDTIGPDATTFTVRGWTASAANGGTVQLNGSVIYPLVDPNNIGTATATTRKVGRVFDPYRGRRSKRSA